MELEVKDLPEVVFGSTGWSLSREGGSGAGSTLLVGSRAEGVPAQRSVPE